MSERAASEPTVVCPFLAYEDERDFRASVPHHRHRCFADTPPGPRALAHQAAYCLTSAFAGCPTFVDWARREAAPPRDVVPPSRTLRDAPAARAGAGAAPAGAAPAGTDVGDRAAPYPTAPASPPGGPAQPAAYPDDWAAGPPWASAPRGSTTPGSGMGGYGVDEAGAGYPPAGPTGRPAGAGAGAAGAAAGFAAGYTAGAGAQGSGELAGEPEVPGQESLGMLEEPEPPAFLAGRALDDGRPVAYQQVASPSTYRAPVGHAGLGAEQRTEEERSGDPAAPPWERPRRRDAYPSLRTRAGFRPGGRGVSRLVMWAGILGIAIVVVFAVPFLFRGLGGSPAGSPSPIATALASPTAEPSPTPEPVATPLVYTVKSGDTLSKIATKYKVTVDKILEANPKITNANKIQPGDKITIPTPPPDEVVDEGEITPAP